MTDIIYKTREEVLKAGRKALGKSLRYFIPPEEIRTAEASLSAYLRNRKGYFGDLVEKHVFGIDNNGRPGPDFADAGVELKTTPIKKHATKTYVSKERLVFSMIDYKSVIGETWETSSFLKKNKLLLLMFYLFEKDLGLLDYEFKFVHLLDLLKDISPQDVEQIKQDWELIVTKINRGEAHLLSEGDTYYLGACTKAKNSLVVRDQPRSEIQAKPRAFSLKQTYLNYLIQENLLGKKPAARSIYETARTLETIDDVVRDKFADYIGKTDKEISELLGWYPAKKPKNYKRLLCNRMLTGTGSNRIKELEKANVTLRVITLEPSGSLRESISFPAFDYKDLITQVWYDEASEKMADFHAQLEMKKFMFVVFQKQAESESVILRQVRFWNFPISDLPEAERVFNETVRCIKEGRYADLPKITDSSVVHVRPHGRDGSDTQETPQGTQQLKKSFWLNARYIRNSIGVETI